MAYRPQFALPPPPDGCRYESFVYTFDESNCPALVGLALTAGETLLHVPLHLDADADFIWLGVKIDPTALGVLLETPWTEPLSDDYTPAVLFAGNVVPTPLEAGTVCPAGSVVSLSLKNLS